MRPQGLGLIVSTAPGDALMRQDWLTREQRRRGSGGGVTGNKERQETGVTVTSYR